MNRRLVVVSNRLPVALARGADGAPELVPGAGGLVTALSPIMERTGGLWLGWAGLDEDPELVESLFGDFTRRHAYELEAVRLSSEEIEGHYHGFSNETIWPLFHDFLGRTRFERDAWNAYSGVNRRFAERIAGVRREGDRIWVHDYHLMLVGAELRAMGMKERLGFFLHIPFPPWELFRALPWRREILEALFEYDLIGVQTLADRRHLLECLHALGGRVRLERGRHTTDVRWKGRLVRVGDFPIGIDFQEFDRAARAPEVLEHARAFHAPFRAEKIAVGVDRLDYSKGIPERFRAFARALELYPDLREKLSLFQLLIPSRVEIPEYRALKDELDMLVGRINGEFSRNGWVPIHYQFRTLSRAELLGVYRAGEMALVTPRRDGMNLVSMEYCAAQVDLRGVLVLSEFAGAAERLGEGALTINPHDREATAEAIHRAFHMPSDERRRRMTLLRRRVRTGDVHRWLRRFLGSLDAAPSMDGAGGADSGGSG